MKIKATFLAGTAMGAFCSAGAAYATTCAGRFNFTGAIESCTVGQTGTYRISAFGAQGGGASIFVDEYRDPYSGEYRFELYTEAIGGAGGLARGDVALTSGQTLQILVGGRGSGDKQDLFLGGDLRAIEDYLGYLYYSQEVSTKYNGGGGGTFVALGASYGTAVPLVVAGGGGGGFGGPGGVLPSGDGSGGLCGDKLNASLGGGSGGGGFYGDGVGDYDRCDNESGGKAFRNGGASTLNGGFGGGGPAAGGDGGGGGFTGGNGGAGYGPGSGGTSFVTASATNSYFASGRRSGDGYLRIELLEEEAPVPVPLPGTGGLVAAGLAGLAAMRAAKRKPKG